MSSDWERVPVAPRGATQLGLSFRPRQAVAFGLDPRATLDRLLRFPFEVLRLGAYWDEIEPSPGRFDTTTLDWQLDAAERAGKSVVLAIGPVKNFGYPEFYVPRHQLPAPLTEHALIGPGDRPALLAASLAMIERVVTRYRDRESIVMWQLEHDAVDPLGFEHSWRLSEAWVAREMAALRAADPTRPVILNGFLPTSTPVRLSQWWRTRDQGDSLDVAGRLGNIVGIDYYPRHAVSGAGPLSVYLSGAGAPGSRSLVRRRVRASGRPVLVTEGQAEPWERVTSPPNPHGREMTSCGPADLIRNYNRAIGWGGAGALRAYLFWGAEYWVLRDAGGDPRYLRAVARVINHA